ncbi:MAG TPA: hypothetical protein VFY20_04860 [Gemmatimonadales bacterium]|nr:hypothetical protein [Gemmatimonadales bacterium]
MSCKAPGRILHRLALATTLLVALAGTLSAQGGPNRPQLDDLVRKLAFVDRAGLEALRTHPATALPGDEGLLARSWVDLVQAEMGEGTNGLVDLADQFGRVVKGHADWGLANLGLARTALLMHGRRAATAPNYAGQLRGRHFLGYTHHMELALRDPVQLGEGLTYAVARLEDEADRVQPLPITKRLAALAERREADARVDLVLARDARTKGEAATALTFIDRYLARGGDAGVGRLERARILAMLDSMPQAVAEYGVGLDAPPTPAARAIYRRDIAWVATGGELAAFDSLAADSVGSYVRRFWAVRDARELRQPGERVAEHLRRWVYAFRYLRVPLAPRRDNVSKLLINRVATACLEGPLSLEDIVPLDPSRPDDARDAERVLDHRAVLWMRHGPPLRVQMRDSTVNAAVDFGRESSFIDERDAVSREFQALLPVSPDFNPDIRLRSGAQQASTSTAFRSTPTQNQAWLYLIEGVPRIYFLSGSSSLGNDNPGTLYLGVIPDQIAVAELLEGLPLEPSLRRDVLLDAAAGRNRFDATRRDYFCSPQGQEWKAEVQEDGLVAATTDSYHRTYEQQLASSARVYTMGRPAAGDGFLIVAIAADTRRLTPSANVPGEYRLALDALTLDPRTADRDQRHADLTFVVDPKTGTEASAAAAMPLRAGHREARIQLSQGEAVGSLMSEIIEPAGNGPGVTASDIVLGEDGARTTVKVSGRAIPVSPSGVFSPKSTLALYYELYGTVPGQKYKSKLALRRTDNPKAGAAASVEFTDEAGADKLQLERRLTLPDIKKGDYQLELTVQDPTGRTVVTRRQAIYVRGK